MPVAALDTVRGGVQGRVSRGYLPHRTPPMPRSIYSMRFASPQKADASSFGEAGRYARSGGRGKPRLCSRLAEARLPCQPPLLSWRTGSAMLLALRVCSPMRPLAGALRNHGTRYITPDRGYKVSPTVRAPLYFPVGTSRSPAALRQSGPFGQARRSTSPSLVRRLSILSGISEWASVPSTADRAASSVSVSTISFAIRMPRLARKRSPPGSRCVWDSPAGPAFAAVWGERRTTCKSLFASLSCRCSQRDSGGRGPSRVFKPMARRLIFPTTGKGPLGPHRGMVGGPLTCTSSAD